MIDCLIAITHFYDCSRMGCSNVGRSMLSGNRDRYYSVFNIPCYIDGFGDWVVSESCSSSLRFSGPF